MAQLQWSGLTEGDLPDLVRLARQCLDADGGLPDLGTPELLAQFFLSGQGLGGRDETTELVAAAGVFVDGLTRSSTGLVHPAYRRQGVGEGLVQWCREASPGLATARIENVSALTEELMAGAGMHATLTEAVLRHPLEDIPLIPLPEGLTRRAYDATTTAAFHEAYHRSFGELPGSPDISLDAWSSGLEADPAFRPDDSRVVLDGAGEPVGFVTVSDGWIDQVGVVPNWRGRGLGAHLVVRSLTALRKSGADAVWLTVNVDNPARELYARLGFREAGLRARYEAG